MKKNFFLILVSANLMANTPSDERMEYLIEIPNQVGECLLSVNLINASFNTQTAPAARPEIGGINTDNSFILFIRINRQNIFGTKLYLEYKFQKKVGDGNEYEEYLTDSFLTIAEMRNAKTLDELVEVPVECFE